MSLHSSDPPDRPVRYGLIGPGSHAHEQLLPALATLEGAELAAIAARTPHNAARAATRWRAGAYVDHWTELADTAVVDAVLVAASPDLHAEILAHCLPRGISVFVEKPPAPDTDTLRRLVDVEQSAPEGVVAFVGFNFPYGSSYTKLRAALAPHGELRSVDVRMVSAKPAVPVRHEATVLDSLLEGLGTHAVDMVVRELGMPDEVHAHAAHIGGHRISVRITMVHRDGRLGTVHIGNHSNRLEYRCEQVTEQGAVGILDQHNSVQVSLPASSARQHLVDAKEVVRYDWPSRRGGYDRTGYSRELESFHQSVRDRLPSTSTLMSCLNTYLVLDRARDQLKSQPCGAAR
ncbi:Gfo/Idh/MocA family oxidoreductase [Streptomyces sp. NPDC005566]|uniref:Gfo/Idh/MocA family protein n=1 Tax=Streptomyces sp. NPDC005566 TaxID=3156886 RepID=UPI0033A54C90